MSEIDRVWFNGWLVGLIVGTMFGVGVAKVFL
jgi:hypothetical protein